jgi:hypothetical protein
MSSPPRKTLRVRRGLHRDTSALRARRSSLERRPLVLLATVVSVGAASILLGGCGGASSSASPSAGAGSSAKPSSSAFAACLKAHGLHFGGSAGAPGASSPAGGGFGSGGGFGGGFGSGGGGFGSSAFGQAFAACASLRPKGAFGSRTGAGFSGTALSAYRNCLKAHGVTLPSGSASGGTTSNTLNAKSPSVQKALAACASLRPKFAPPSS